MASRIRTHAKGKILPAATPGVHRTRKIPTDKTKKVHAAEPAEAYFHVFCWSYAAKAPKPSELAAVLKRSARSLGLMGSAGLLSGLPQGSPCSTYFLAVDVYGSSGVIRVMRRGYLKATTSQSRSLNTMLEYTLSHRPKPLAGALEGELLRASS